jgi:diguanylate cyclase (GGDEF)-like protein
MRTLSARLSAGVVLACALFAACVLAIGVLGIVGVRTANSAGNQIAHDELSTANITAQFGHDVDLAYATAQQMWLSDASARAPYAARLYDSQMPAVEADIAALVRIHEGDGAAELSGIDQATSQWATMRALLNPSMAATPGPDAATAARLSGAYQPLSTHIASLIAREDVDARDDQARASDGSDVTSWGIAGAVLATIALSIGLGWRAARRLRRAVEPAQEQVEFADTLQFAEGEGEAHQLLQRHLERTIATSTVTVLNRNNSADRLEAMTALPPGSALQATLVHAEPRSCLAVRSGRSHDEDDQHAGLLACSVCAACPGRSTCTPLTVGGEVIGSVLVNRRGAYSIVERQQIRDSVGQAAPVLANLRNLAIAELRAATDSLTGLPNKRAVDDTLKRMLAQASRTFTPLSLLLLDLDHFKNVNDRFGHPVGDQALANVGAALRSVLRDSDFAGRSGGEEFAVLLPDTDVAGAVLTAERIRAAVAETTIAGLELTITASVGVAAYPEHAIGADQLERLADAALYVAKRSGRDRIEIATRVNESALERAAGSSRVGANPADAPANGASANGHRRDPAETLTD